MMQFLTKILSKKNKNSNKTNTRLLEDRISELELRLENYEKVLCQYNNALRDFSIINESLCTEFAVLGKLISQNAKQDYSEDISIGMRDTDDDEYLN